MTQNHSQFQNRSESEGESEGQTLPAPVAIIGASLTGLSLALSLLQSNLYRPVDITIYDQRRGPAPAASPSTQPASAAPNSSADSPPASSSNSSSAPGFSSSSANSGSSSVGNGYDPATTASGVVLTPNGLRVLDGLGILDRVRAQCWTSIYRTYRADAGPEDVNGDSNREGDGKGDKLVRKVQVSGEEVYGYRNHRLWRSVLVGAMLDMVVREQGVDVRWGWRFEGIVTNDDNVSCGHEAKATQQNATEGVTFSLKRPDGAREERTAGLLVGADGIYSSVRGVLHPHAAPVYTGTTGVLAHIRWDDVSWPRVEENDGAYERQCTLQGKPGALFWIPEDERGSVVMVGKQVKMEDANNRTRDEWERLARDKEYLSGFYRQDYEQWGPTGRKVIDAVCKNSETLYLWPFMRMAKLDTWFSLSQSPSKSRTGDENDNTNTNPNTNALILLMGDAAHALPPSSGQGVNQTLEDVYVLTQALLSVQTGAKPLTEALQFWQDKRQDRIDAVFDWATNATNVQRLPQAEREKLMKEEEAKGKKQQEGDDMRWLYKPDWDDVVAKWRAT